MSEVAAGAALAPQTLTQTAAPSSLEAQLFSYMAQLQAQSLVTGKGAMLANPALLSGEVFRYLRDFIKRAAVAEKIVHGKGRAASGAYGSNSATGSESGLRFASLNTGASPLHRGPAYAPLTLPASETLTDRPVDGSPDEGRRLIDEIITLLQFHAEATIVTNGSAKMIQDVNALIKSQ